MKIYISGPISGQPDGNKKAFQSAAEAIRAKGHEPVNPHEIGVTLGEGATWEQYMRADIKAMMDCDAVLMLPGWVQSDGAMIEHRLAGELGIKTLYNLVGV